MAMQTLHDLFVEELRDLYNAENQLLKALPKMAKKASTPELKAAFEEHVDVTRGQVNRLEKIFSDLDESPKGKKCKGMTGLVDEEVETVGDAEVGPVKDAALITAAQKIEHYEIAGYGCVRAYARRLGYGDAEALLRETLNEEGEADKRLTELAESTINDGARNAGNGMGADGKGRSAKRKLNTM